MRNFVTDLVVGALALWVVVYNIPAMAAGLLHMIAEVLTP